MWELALQFTKLLIFTYSKVIIHKSSRSFLFLENAPRRSRRSRVPLPAAFSVFIRSSSSSFVVLKAIFFAKSIRAALRSDPPRSFSRFRRVLPRVATLLATDYGYDRPAQTTTWTHCILTPKTYRNTRHDLAKCSQKRVQKSGPKLNWKVNRLKKGPITLLAFITRWRFAENSTHMGSYPLSEGNSHEESSILANGHHTIPQLISLDLNTKDLEQICKQSSIFVM